jgi:two-component system, LuxR family, response regulator FixJ
MADRRMVHIVDDDEAVRDAVKSVVEQAGYACLTHGSAAEFLQATTTHATACALVDVRMPQMDGLALLAEMAARHYHLPVIIMTGFADVPMAVKAMKAGAFDFIEKPCPRQNLIDAVERALAKAKTAQVRDAERSAARNRLDKLTQRELEVLNLLVAGNSNKAIAHKLGISPRTVEIHRGHLTEKTEVASFAELVRLAYTAGAFGDAS